MARKTAEELNNIMKQYGKERLWSWSRFNSYHNTSYEYFLHYILNKPKDRQDCIYGITGGFAHDIMEKLYKKEIEYKEMDIEFEDAWMVSGVAELKFDRNDSVKNKNISDKYYKSLKHFFNNHDIIPHKVEIERFITIIIGSHLFQGYIDICFKDSDGCINIMDWKTSSLYKGNKALNECGQLVVYALGLNQMGIPMDKIKICWNFLKYVNIDCMQANEKWTTRQIARYEIGSKLQTSAKMWLKKLGYEENMMEYLDCLIQTNDIKCLPKDVQEKYKISDCIIYVDLIPELLERWTTDIINTIEEIIEKEYIYTQSKDESIFYDTPEQVKNQSYYFATLCEYSPKLHKPYKKYLDELEAKKNGDNLFSGVGSATGKSNNIDGEDTDMSWIDML